MAVLNVFLPDALDYSSPFTRALRRLLRSFESERCRKRRMARRRKERCQDRLNLRWSIW